MGKCGCAGTTCGCKIVGDGGIIVTGAGTATNPYRVSGSGGLSAVDTPSINMTILGSGSQSDPWLISADFAGQLDDLLDVDTSGGVPGDVLALQADGSYALVAPATTAPGLIATGTSLEGDGSGGSPLNLRLASNSGLEITGSGVRVDPYTVTTSADLDSLYGSLPAGSVVSDDDGSGVWVKTTSGWVSLIEDTGTITTLSGYVTEASGFDIDAIKVRRRNGIVQLWLLVTPTSTIASNSTGNIGNVHVGDIVPANLRPVYTASMGAGAEWGPMIGAWINNAGRIGIGALEADEPLAAGTQFSLHATYIGA